MKARVMLLVGATSSLVLIAFLVPLAVLVRSAATDRALSAAIVDVQALAPTVATAPDRTTLEQAVAAANATSRHRMTVFLADGTAVGAPVTESSAVRQAASGESFTVAIPGGDEIVVAVAGLPEGTAVIRTFVPDAELQAGVTRSWLILGLLGAGLLGLSLLVANLLARTLTRPLSELATVSYRLAQGGLAARAKDAGPPEVRQVSAGLNQLADRITDLLAQERATVADLSHRLRTPLTALRIDVETLSDPDVRDRLVADLDAVDRRVDEVIRDADRPVRDGAVVASDATVTVGERVRFWSALAEDERRRFTADLPRHPVPVRVGTQDLSACVDALIGNVFAHTPEGTAFHVTLIDRHGGGAALVVSDDGAGIADMAAVERGVSGGGSTGLGLDIVRRAAERSGGGVTIGRAPSSGAQIIVEFGPPAPRAVGSHRDRRLAP
jgi:signal transduction histidine kinase